MSTAHHSPADATEELARLRRQNAALQARYDDIQARYEEVQRQLDWFKRQLFGRKSEKRLQVLPEGTRDLFGMPVAAQVEPQPQASRPARTRNTKNREGAVTAQGLRFDPDVPVQTLTLRPTELDGPEAEDLEVLSYEESYRLGQRPASYVVFCIRRPKIRHRRDDRIETPPAPDNVIAGSQFDASFLAGMLVDKFCYHQPLYRQHQRLEQNGIQVSRSSLTQNAHRAIDLLEPIYEAQLASIRQSRVLAMDETPIKAGRKKKGRMQQAWYWPLYGDRDELAFTFSPTRAGAHIRQQLKGFSGTLLTDGYRAYTRFAEQTEGITQAQCWAHTRRQFLKAEDLEPKATAQALDYIGALYRHEQAIRDKQLKPDKALDYRSVHSKPIVDAFFGWCWQQRQRDDLLPRNPLAQALAYATEREASLRVFLTDPAVAIDTNHLERALRVIPMGRKNWLFCWTEVGARKLGIVQSLLTTCRLHGINPYTYLLDVLQRVSIHPASDVAQLTPRLWKEHFADQPLPSMLDAFCQ